jgi:integrase
MLPDARKNRLLTFSDMLPTFDDMKRNRKRRKPETVKAGDVTVKIYRRRKVINGKAYTVFEVADYTTGTRRLRSFSDHGKALAEAGRLARQISTGEATAATMRNSEAASYGRAIELLRPTGASLEVAAAGYAKAFEILGGDSVIEAANFYARHRADLITRKTVAEVVAELVDVKKARGKSARYIGDLSARLARFATAFAVDIGTVTTGDVQRWMDGLKVAPQTAKNFRTVIGTLFSFAESRGYIFKGGNPVADVEQVTANGGAIEIYSPEEIAGLLKAAPKDFLPVLALGAFAGLRAAEIERLEWPAVDLAGGFITVDAEKAKTKARRLVPALPNLAQWLAPYAARKGNVWQGSVIALREARAETVKAAGVPWKDNGLRHSFISYRLAQIQNAAQVALEAGNSPAIVFRHYRELVKPEAAKTWFAITPQAPENVVSMGKVQA